MNSRWRDDPGHEGHVWHIDVDSNDVVHAVASVNGLVVALFSGLLIG